MRDGGGWLLRGVKRWNASSWAGVVSVFVRMLEADGKLGGLSGLAVRQGTPGLRIGPEALTTGLRGSVQNSLFLQDVPVGPENLLGEPGKGMAVADDALTAGRICTAAVALGAMKRCAQLMARYADRRTISTGRLLDNPVTLFKLDELTTLITLVEAILRQVAGLLDRGVAVPHEIAMALKISASEAAVWAANELMQLLGGRGYMENNIAPQLLRDSRVLTVGEGPNETLSLFVGRSAIQTETIGHFLAETMGVPEIAHRLKQDVGQILERCTSLGGPFPHHSQAISWASFLGGKMASEALLLAAIWSATRQNPAPHLTRALERSQSRYDEVIRMALLLAAGKSHILAPLEANRIISGYIESIGDVEQNLPGEEDALDQLLRIDPAVSPGSLPDGLPGAMTFTGGQAVYQNGKPSSTQGQPGALTLEAKRERLEQALRKTIAASETQQATHRQHEPGLSLS
jgi:hypothetical protein